MSHFGSLTTFGNSMDTKRKSRLPSKECLVCGRAFEWRKKWRRNWLTVRYCSKRCSKHPLTQADRQLEQSILECLEMGNGRVLGVVLFEQVRVARPKIEDEKVKSAARRLAHQGALVWFQSGRKVSPDRCSGAFELRRCTT